MKRLLGKTIFGILAVYLISEFLLRIFTGNFAIANLIEIDNESNCPTLKKNAHVVYTGMGQKIDRPVVQESNKFGFRGTLTKQNPEVQQVIVLGDSFVYGVGLTSEETIPAKLTEIYYPQYNFLNFGVPGYNLAESIDRYKHFANAWDHSFVLLFIYSNDLAPPLCEMVPSERVRMVFKYSYLFRLSYLIIYGLFREKPALSSLDKKLELQQLIQELQSEAGKKNASVIPVVLSWPISIADKSNPIGIEYIDLTSATAYAHKIPKEGHFSALGAIEIARELSSRLEYYLD